MITWSLDINDYLIPRYEWLPDPSISIVSRGYKIMSDVPEPYTPENSDAKLIKILDNAIICKIVILKVSQLFINM